MSQNKVRKTIYVDDLSKKICGKWWDMEGPDLAGAVFAECRDIRSKYSTHYRNMTLNEAVYSACSYGWNTSMSGGANFLDNLRLNRNCAGAICDTLVSKICKNVPTVQYLTKDGDWGLQKKAKDLSLFVQGRFQHEKMDMLSPRVFLEGVKQGTSAAICRLEDTGVTYELVRPQQVHCSGDSAILDDAESIHIVFFRNRYNLAKKYHKKLLNKGEDYAADEAVEAILKAPGDFDVFAWDRMAKTDEDIVLTIESYSKFKNRRTVCVDGYVLEDEEWNLYDGQGNTMFPLAWFRYKPGNKNLFNKGLIEDIRTLQWEMDKILRSIAKATHLVAVPKLLTHISSNIKQSAVNNEIGRINWRGKVEPRPFQLGQVPKDYYEQLEAYCKMQYQISGLSELTAGSQKPAGLNSGEALKTYYNIESDRFQMTGQAYENFYLELNEVTLRILHQMPTPAKMQTLYRGKKFSKQLDFKKVKMDVDQISMMPFVISREAMTPSVQLQYATELMQLELIDKETALKLFDLPDVDSYSDLQTSESNYVMSQMDSIANGGEGYFDINQDLAIAMKIARQCYFDYMNKGLDEDCLDRIRNYIVQLSVIDAQRTAQQQLYMQSAMAQQAQQIGARNGTNPSAGTNSGYAAGADPTGYDIRTAAGTAGPPES